MFSVSTKVQKHAHAHTHSDEHACCVLVAGPRLFKEPSAKSNKLIIQNAIAHCCLAGKVNEAQKNAVLEVIYQSLTEVVWTHTINIPTVC